MTIELSVSALAFDGYAFADACAGIAEAGGDFVEPAFVASYGPVDETAFTPANAAAMKAAATAAGLGITTLSAHVDTGAADAVERLRRRLGFAAALGAARVVSNAAGAGEDHAFRRNLVAIAAAARAEGVRVCLENPGAGASVFADAATMAAWADEIDDPFLGINLDLGNAFTASAGREDPARDYDASIARATSFHLKDFARVPGGLQACAVGDGVIDYDRILRRIGATRPDATAGLEMPLRVVRPDEGEPYFEPVRPRAEVVATVARALDFARRTLAAGAAAAAEPRGTAA